MATKAKWTAGWNMPGFLPDMTPETFDSFEEARSWVIIELKNDEDYVNGDDLDSVHRAMRELEAYEGPGEWGETVTINGLTWAYWITQNT